MILDERTEFADNVVIPTALGRAIFGDTVDMSVARNVGSPPKPLYLVIQITEAVLSAGAATVAFELVTDAQAPVLVDGSATVHWRSSDFPKATLIIGFTVVIPLPGVKPEYEQFLAVLSIPGTAVLTAGKANAFLTPTPKQWKALKDGI